MTRMVPAVVLLERGRPPVIEQVEIHDPGPGDVLVRIMASGICHTDIAAMRDARSVPLLLGHEGAGIVEAVGDGVETVAPGDHVIINWQAKCGTCRNCRRGRPQFCEAVAGTVAPRVFLRGAPLPVLLNAGTFCPFAIVPAGGAVAIDREMPFAIAALIGCAVATGIGAALSCAKVAPGDSVAIIGAGGVGLNTVQGARLGRADPIIAVDPDPRKRALATRMGATHAVDPTTEDAGDAVRRISGGRGVDHVFELVGRTELMRGGIDWLARGGTLTLVGAAARDAVLGFEPRSFMSRQLRLCGCIYGEVQPERDLPRFVDWYRRGLIDLDALHTGTIGLAEVPAQFEAAAAPGSVRTVIDMERIA